MADDSLLEKIHALSDLELAVLLCLISREHCLMSTPPEAIDDLIQELQLVASKTFGLQYVVIDCTPSTSLEDFASALLIPQQPTTAGSSSPHRTESYFHSRASSHPSAALSPTTSQIANVVLAKNLDRAPRAVQIQALELLRTRRIFTRTAVHSAPKQFIFVPVLEALSGGEARVTEHLNDYFYIAYWHDPEDGFVNLDEGDGGDDAETASTGSVVKKGQGEENASPGALILESEISQLGKLSQEVQVDIDVIRYQMNIISFLRLHRAISEGITPAATKHFGQLMRCLAPLHRLDYVTPALVGLAAKKVYLHRIRICLPEKERSMQWGSRLEAVEALLDDVGPEDVVEDVLGMVTAPL
ncbi:Fc.00g049580.m01.CDS01 [Cosmosporella sp. VM-42]